MSAMKPDDDCQHWIVTRWKFIDDDPADLWACDKCRLKFEPITWAKQRYESANPLGGPARMFEVISERIRSGEEYNAVLADYGVTVESRHGT